MADKTIKVKVDVETDVEPSIANLKALKRQIKDTAAGTEEFLRLQQQIDDVQDSLSSARKGAGNFVDVLGGLPGPIGAIGGQASGLIATLKQFGALKVSDLQSSFVELGKDLGDVAKGFFDLTGITKVYTILNTALARSFVAVGVSETAAAAGAKAFAAALTATGIGALVVGLGLLIANWDKIADAISGATAESKTYEEAQVEVTKSLTDFNKKLIDVESSFKAAKEGTISKEDALKKYNDTLGATVGYAGSLDQAEKLLASNTQTVIEGIKLKTQANVFYAKSAEAAAKAISGEGVDPSFWQTAGNFIKSGGSMLSLTLNQAETMVGNFKELSETEKKFSAEGDKLTKLAIENDKKLKKGLSKAPDFSGTKKAAADALAEIKKGLEEARLTLLGEQAKELELVKLKYDALAAKAKKFGMDTAIIEQARQKENATIIDKYAKQEKEKAERAAKEALDIKEKALADGQKIISEAAALEEAQLSLKLAKGEISESEYQTKLFDIRKNAAIKNETLASETLKKEQDLLKVSYESGKISLEEYNNRKATLEADALAKNKEFITAEVELEKYKTEQKKLTAEEERNILLTDLQAKFEALDRENALLDGDFQADLERIQQQKDILAEQEAADLANQELTEFQKTEIRKKYADARIALSDKEIATEKSAMEAKHAINMAYLGLFEQFGNVLGQIAGKNKALAIAGVVVSQAAAIGQIIAQTAIANAKSVAVSPLTGGMPWVAINTISAGLSIASTIASAVKSIQQINSAENSTSSAASGAGGGASLPAPPSAPSVAAVSAPQIQTQGGTNPTQQLGETIGAAKAPLKAYVVSGDVTSQQALDRRTNRAATFSGG